MAPFPLPANFFHCPPLTAKERRQFQLLAREVSADVIRKAQTANLDMHWRLVSDADDVQVFQGEDPTTPTPMVTGALNVSHTDESYKASRRLTEKGTLLDCAHMYTVVDTDTDAIDIRWLSFKSPVRSVIKCRDMVPIEVQHRCVVDGRAGYVVGAASIKLGCCPNFRKSLGLIRTTVHRMGAVYLETDRPGILQVNRMVQINFGGSIPSWMVNLAQLARMRAMKHLDRFFQQQRLSAQTFLPAPHLVPKAARSRCFLCQTSFGLLSVKTQCQKCGQVMCRSCVNVWSLHISGFDTKVTVCSACTLVPRETTEISPIDTCLDAVQDYYHRLNRRPNPPSPIVLSPHGREEAPILLTSPSYDSAGSSPDDLMTSFTLYPNQLKWT
ncbi:unnamed protein product [Aphanomyces euteiches]|nr:hypothetical protein AeRB84_017551 [Aphanomyces euteiches]